MMDFVRGLVVVLGVTLMLVTQVMLEVAHDKGDPSVRLFFFESWPEQLSIQAGVADLTAMGGACPFDVCENGGTCLLVEGKYQCQCTPGFIGHKCQDMRLDLACDQREMRLRVPKASLADLNVNFSTLLTSSGMCPAVESPLYISITLTHENHTQCGTEVKVNGTHLIYSNELSTELTSPQMVIPGNSISRSANIRISFSCVYQYDRVVSLPYPLLTSASLVTFVVQEGEFNVSMTLHPTADFLDPYNRPPIIPLSDTLYVQLQMLGYDSQDIFNLRLDECWATPGPDHANEIKHLIISSGIAHDSTVVMLESKNQSLSRFSLQMFHFVKYPEFYLHCRVWLYQPNASDCCDQPKTNNRHIRDVSDPYRKVVSCGPIRLSRISVSSIGKPESGLNPIIFPASSAAAMILLLLGLVTIAKVLRKRVKLRGPPPICMLLPAP